MSCINGTNTNNLTGDPALNGNLTRANVSSAINAGDNSLIPDGITTDLAGNARIQNMTVDMGAYESAFMPATLTLQLSLESRPTPPTNQHIVSVHVQLRPTAGGAAVWSGDAIANTSGQVTLSGLPTGHSEAAQLDEPPFFRVHFTLVQNALVMVQGNLWVQTGGHTARERKGLATSRPAPSPHPTTHPVVGTRSSAGIAIVFRGRRPEGFPHRES